MPDQAPDLEISVIICAYTEERWHQLLASVESIREQTLQPFEVIVVIDHNAALYERACRALEGVMVIENHEPRGLSGARNSGLALAKGNVIAFIDEDATASADWLEILGADYQEENILGVGGQIKSAWQTGRPAWFPEEFDWVVGCTYLGLPGQTAPVRNLIGCNMSFRRKVPLSVGGFRHGIGRIGSLPTGCEETELCIRAGRFWPGQSFVYDPKAAVLHRVPKTRSTFAYFVSRCYSEGLSKALVSRFTGARRGLNSELKYVLKALPLGAARGVRDAILHGDIFGLARAGAILCGLFFTVCGFVIGAVGEQWKARNVLGDEGTVPASAVQ
jgi:glucosyl-dolichyl phosphate glucuronosyltransferase